MVRRFALASVSVIALTVAASAADMYVPGPVSGYKDGPVEAPLWNGPYVGINGGYGWGDSNLSCDGFGICDKIGFDGTKNFGTSGAFGGGQVGYNWQPGSAGGYKDGPAYSGLVLGIEADIQGADITGSEAFSYQSTSVKATNNLDWFATVRARAGFAAGAALIYGTGGFAFGGVQDKLTATGYSTVSDSKTATGYAVGGGIEYAFNPAWSGKVEYQYIDLGSNKLANGAGDVTADLNHNYNTVRAGLNYHVGPVYEPLK